METTATHSCRCEGSMGRTRVVLACLHQQRINVRFHLNIYVAIVGRETEPESEGLNSLKILRR